ARFTSRCSATDFHPCAIDTLIELALSFETARHFAVVVVALPPAAGGVKGKRPSAVAVATPDPVLAVGALRLRDAGASPGGIRRGPLSFHQRPLPPRHPSHPPPP